MTQDQKLTALLRLKRCEQPPAGYYEKLLQDIHRRQRAELLRRPLWAIGIERIQTFFSAHSMGNLSFAGSMAVVALAGLLGIGMIGSTHQNTETPVAVASATVPSVPVAAVVESSPSPRTLLLQEEPFVVAEAPDEEALNNARLVPASISQTEATLHQPRYVIDTRPVSYEATKVSFSF